MTSKLVDAAACAHARVGTDATKVQASRVDTNALAAPEVRLARFCTNDFTWVIDSLKIFGGYRHRPVQGACR